MPNMDHAELTFFKSVLLMLFKVFQDGLNDFFVLADEIVIGTREKLQRMIGHDIGKHGSIVNRNNLKIVGSQYLMDVPISRFCDTCIIVKAMAREHAGCSRHACNYMRSYHTIMSVFRYIQQPTFPCLP